MGSMRWALVGVVLLAMCGCSSGGRAQVDPRILPGRPLALDACRRWDSVTAHNLAPAQEAAALVEVVRVANDATNRDLIYVQLRDQVDAVIRGEEAGTPVPVASAKRTVNEDCRRTRNGKAPTGLTGESTR
jgi:hypothetical protein